MPGPLVFSMSALSTTAAQGAVRVVGGLPGQVSEGWEHSLAGRGKEVVSLLKLKSIPQGFRHGEMCVVVVEGDKVGVVKVMKRARSIAGLEEVIRAGFDSMDASVKSGKRHLRRAKPSNSLSRAERELLEKGGLDLSPPPEGKDPIKATADLYRTLRETSLSVEEAAGRLQVNDSRIRQRLLGKHRSLYGLKEGKSWRLPAFQFTEHGLLPGLGSVVAKIPKGAHPVSVYRWFTLPHQDLYLDGAEEKRISPRDWLETGGEPKVVAELAREI